MSPSITTIIFNLLLIGVSAIVGYAVFVVKQYQVSPPSLELRNLTCALQPRLCSPLKNDRAPDELKTHGRWRQAARNPRVGDESSLQFKRWYYVSFNDDKYFVGAAFVKFSYISDVFLYVVDKSTHEHLEYTGRLPFGFGLECANSSIHGCTKWGTPQLELHNGTRPWMELCSSESDGIRLRASVPVTSKSNSAKPVPMRLDISMKGRDDLILAFPLEGKNDRLVYVHKLAGAPVKQGSMISFGDTNAHLFQDAVGGLDWTKGKVLYRTFWRWVSLNDAHAKVSRGGRTEKEELFGINLSEEVYDVVSANGNVLSAENAIWLDGRVFPLSGPVKIYVPDNPKVDPWVIRSLKPTDEEHVDLIFFPKGAREDHTNFGIIVSDFIQPFGRFAGSITVVDDKTKEKISIQIKQDSAFGVVENHMAFW